MIAEKLDRASLSSMSRTAFVTLALTLVAHKVYTSSGRGYRLTKRKVKAAGLTAVEIGKDAKTYVCKKYKKTYASTT